MTFRIYLTFLSALAGFITEGKSSFSILGRVRCLIWIARAQKWWKGKELMKIWSNDEKGRNWKVEMYLWNTRLLWSTTWLWTRKKKLFMQVINKAMHFFYLLTHTGESRICKGWNWQWKSKVPKIGKKNMFVKPVSHHTCEQNIFISAPILTSYSIHTAEQLEFKHGLLPCVALWTEKMICKHVYHHKPEIISKVLTHCLRM